MNMKSLKVKSTIIALSTSIILLSAPFGYANDAANNSHADTYESKHKRMYSHDRSRLKKMARYLEFTEEQRTAAKDIAARTKEAMTPLKERMKAFKESVKAMTLNSDFDEDMFADSYEQNKETFYQMALIKAKMGHELMQLMTDEQKEKWEAKKENKRAKRG